MHKEIFILSTEGADITRTTLGLAPKCDRHYFKNRSHTIMTTASNEGQCIVEVLIDKVTLLQFGLSFIVNV